MRVSMNNDQKPRYVGPSSTVTQSVRAIAACHFQRCTIVDWHMQGTVRQKGHTVTCAVVFIRITSAGGVPEPEVPAVSGSGNTTTTTTART